MKNKRFINPMVTVDIIVPMIYWDIIPLIKRKNPPFQNSWALPGGFVNTGKETLEEVAIRELKEETNITGKIKDLKLFQVRSDPNRDPRGHVISHIFILSTHYCFELQASDDAIDIGSFYVSSEFYCEDREVGVKHLSSNIAFDHREIIDEYKNSILNKIILL